MFQDRFKSEPVESDDYFLTVIRYIHQNPLKAGLCSSIQEYPFSSYTEYSNSFDLIDSSFVFDLLSKETFAEYNETVAFDKCLDVETKPIIKTTDEQAKSIIEQYSKCTSVADFQNLDINTRNNYLKLFREKGLSIRQISRLTGVSFNVVRKF